MIVKIKKNNGAKTPIKAYNNDACYDVFATSIEDIGDGRIKYGTGLHLQIPEYTQIDIRSRSSIHKTGLILSNGIGTGDEGYTGEYQVIFYNIITNLPNYVIGDKICQIQLVRRIDMEFDEVEELSETHRGDGAFGSSGK